MSNGYEVTFLTEKIREIIEKLSDKKIKIIESFDLEMDLGRPMQPWELRLIITKGKTKIYANKAEVKPIKSLIEFGILRKLEGTDNTILTKLGEEIRKSLEPTLEESIPIAAKERMLLIQDEISKIDILSENEYILKSWNERYLTLTQELIPVLIDESDQLKKKLMTALGLFTWNTIYQPTLINIDDFLRMLKIPESFGLNHVYVICKCLKSKFYLLDKDLWFITKDLDFWRTRYKCIFRYLFNKTNIDGWLEKENGMKFIKKKAKEIIKNRNTIVKDTITHLADEILNQKGWYWNKKFKNDSDWLQKRLNLMLF